MSSCGSSSYIIDDDQSRLEMNSLFLGSTNRSGAAPKPYRERNLPASFYRPPQAEKKKRKDGNGQHIKNQSSLPGNPLTTRIDHAHVHARAFSDSGILGGQTAINTSMPFSNAQFTALPLPDGWEERRLPEGQLYYIE